MNFYFNFRELICWLKAIPFFFTDGMFIPHVFETQREFKGDIFVTKRGFRILEKGESLEHEPGEELVRNVTVIESKCKYCGKLDYAWFRNEEDIVEL